MREKKFRIWDKNNKVFLEDYYTNKFLIDLDGKPFKISNSVIEQIKGVELMRYTGIKDIAGTEIFEGDIVSWKNNNENTFKYAKVFFFYLAFRLYNTFF